MDRQILPAMGGGQTFLGTMSTAGPGSFTATLPAVPVNQFVTATAGDDNGNTSEFSNSCIVLSGSGTVAKVTNTADSGLGSLRDAIGIANANAGTTIAFQIPTADPGFSGGVFTIQPTSALPSINANATIIDGNTQTAFTGNTNPSGPEIVLNGSLAGGAASGLTISAGNCCVQGLVINGFFQNGIIIIGISATGNKVQGCFIGTDTAGTSAVANGSGININNTAQNNTIGGTSASFANVISGNSFGVLIIGANAANNVVEGNFIGTNPSGAAPVGNSIAGVEISSGAFNNLIGGTSPGTLNVISGNANGILIDGNSTTGNRVFGNHIGINVAGTAALANSQNGVVINNGALSNTIGGAMAAARNVISGNSQSRLRTRVTRS